MDRSVVMQQIEQLGGPLVESLGPEADADDIPTETLHEVCSLVQALPDLNTKPVTSTLRHYAFQRDQPEFAQLLRLCRQHCNAAGVAAVVQFDNGPLASGSLAHCDFVNALWLLQALGKVGIHPATYQEFVYCYRQLHMLGRVRYDSNLDQVVASNIEPFLHAAAGQDPFAPKQPERPFRPRRRWGLPWPWK